MRTVGADPEGVRGDARGGPGVVEGLDVVVLRVAVLHQPVGVEEDVEVGGQGGRGAACGKGFLDAIDDLSMSKRALRDLFSIGWVKSFN